MSMDGNESVVLYTTPDGAVKVNAVVKNETLWLTQAAMAELFGVVSQAITKHLKNIYAEGELSLETTCSKMEQVQNEGERQVSREVCFYNFDAQPGTSKAYAYRVNAIEVLPGTLGGRIALATDPTGTTSICGSILLNGVPEVNGLAKEFP